MRRYKTRLLVAVTGACAAISCGILLAIVGAIAARGFPAIRWGFFTEQIRLVGAAGGIFHNLFGTLILVGTALAVCTPIAVGLALVAGFYSRGTPWRGRLVLLLHVLNGVPSILFGILGLIVFVKFLGWGKSWLSGGILLGMMIVPTVAQALLDRIESLPKSYLEAAAGLGLAPSQIVWSVVLPQCRGGLITGSLLGLARAAGETAPIMFTATIFSGATFPRGIRESPVLSLPYHIFVLAQDSFDPTVGEKLWGTALVLVGMVFMLGIVALPMRLRVHEEARNP